MQGGLERRINQIASLSDNKRSGPPIKLIYLSIVDGGNKSYILAQFNVMLPKKEFKLKYLRQFKQMDIGPYEILRLYSTSLDLILVHRLSQISV